MHETATKGKQDGKEVGKEEATVSVRIPKSGSSKVVRFRNARCGLFVEEGCFLLDALESRVHFERLGDCLAAFGIDVVAPETASKEEAEEKEIGKGRSKSQRAHSKRAGQARSSASGMQGVVCLWRKRCFLLDALESRVHFERLCDCYSAFGSDCVGSETSSKEEAERKRLGREEAKVSVRIPKSGSSKVVRCRTARCGLFVEEEVFLLDALESRVHFERPRECLSAFGSDAVV